jgi:signal transduction histidine kinase
VRDTLVIVWEDNGVGIEQSDKEKIFERGYGKNTGLGMFLAREILALTDISIIESGIAGKGARFEMVVLKNGWKVITS